GQIIVCEGYTDVIGCAKAGIPRAVATCGTALTEQHMKLMTRFAKKIVLAFDADGAGQAAADRFYAWEKSYEVEVFVAQLPSGSDPGQMAEENPEALVEAIESARPFLEHRIARVLQSVDLTTAEGRARAADMAAQIISEHPNDLVRDQYVVEFADKLKV
ncbi:MAG: toprim domain-containing protein, partial [Acidimicrobiales bacterium]